MSVLKSVGLLDMIFPTFDNLLWNKWKWMTQVKHETSESASPNPFQVPVAVENLLSISTTRAVVKHQRSFEISLWCKDYVFTSCSNTWYWLFVESQCVSGKKVLELERIVRTYCFYACHSISKAKARFDCIVAVLAAVSNSSDGEAARATKRILLKSTGPFFFNFACYGESF